MKRPEFPPEVTIDGRTIKLRRRRLDRFPDGYPKAGIHVPGLITVGTGGTLREDQDTVVHELLHEIIHQSDARLKRPDEEYIVTCLSTRLVELFRDPDLVAFLAAE